MPKYTMRSRTGSARIASMYAIDGQRIHARRERRPSAKSRPAGKERSVDAAAIDSVSSRP